MVSIAPINYDTGLPDYQWYLQQNPDLALAGIDTPHEAISHYMNYGKYEGRVPSAALMQQVTTQGEGVRPLNVASMTEPQKQALYDMTQAPAPVDPRIGQAFESARSSIQGMTDPFDPESYQQFMNPYLQDVVSAVQDDITKSYDSSRQRMREEMGAAGAFGSSALGRGYADIEEAQNRQLGSQLSGLRAQGFDTAQGNALNLYGMNQANRAGQASQFMNLGQNFTGLDQYGRGVQRQGTMDMLGAGGQIQGQNQRELDAYFADVNRQIQFPYQQTNYLQGTLRAYPTGETATSTQPGIGPIQGALGGAMMGSRLGGMFNQANYNAGGFRHAYNPANTYFPPNSPLPWNQASF